MICTLELFAIKAKDDQLSKSEREFLAACATSRRITQASREDGKYTEDTLKLGFSFKCVMEGTGRARNEGLPVTTVSLKKIKAAIFRPAAFLSLGEGPVSAPRHNRNKWYRINLH